MPALSGAQPPDNVDKLRERMFKDVNALRAVKKVAPLKRSTKLDAAVQTYSEKLAKQDKLEDNQDGKGPVERLRAEDYTAGICVEMGTLGVSKDKKLPTEANAAAAIKNLEKSAAENGLLISDKFTEIGIAVARGKNGKWYYWIVLAAPAEVEHVVETAGAANLEALRERVLKDINALRAVKKLAPFQRNSKLDDAALKHAENMARQRKFSDDPKKPDVLDGKNTLDRMRAENYEPVTRAEVYGQASELEKNRQSEKEATAVVQAWGKTATVTDVLLGEQFTEIGIGLARSKEGLWYYSLMLGKPAP